jgi:RNA polymerase sigma-70 factor (ECF subfamily)
VAIATEQLWSELSAGLRVFVGRRVRNPADVDDIVQRVFLSVHRGLPALRDGDRVHAWIYQTARNAIVDHYRSPVRRREVNVGVDVDRAEAADYQDGAIEENEDSAASELAGCMQPLMRSLSEADAEALRLTELEGITQTEGAARLGLSVSGMKSRVQRARRRLRMALDECCRIALDRRGSVMAYEPRQGCGCGPCGDSSAPREALEQPSPIRPSDGG